MIDLTRKVTVPVLADFKTSGVPITMLTAYDFSLARRVDEAGVDCVLVGDSLGNVIQGQDSTLPVTVDDMVYHTAAVAQGLKRALLVADLPFMSYHDRATAMASAAALMRAGASMVKLEGGSPMVDIVRALVEQGIPVCAHLGLTPQHVHRLGGYRVQGREQALADALVADAKALEAAGAPLLVVECIPNALAERVTQALSIPVIGIGAGAGVDGQVLVCYDMLGISTGRLPRFVRDFMIGAESIPEALQHFVEAVRARQFPSADESYE
ncbi:MAG: 3-methyl-2-oxobutanoate hydroxymethyltransferase [Pseudomonadota bacterium]